MQQANDNAPVANGIRFKVDPRLVPVEKAARRLSLDAAQFGEKSTALFAMGFPRPFPVIGHYDLVAIEAWLDRQSGLAPANGPKAAAPASEAEMRARLETLG